VNEMANKVKIEISEEIYEKIKNVVEKSSEFASVEDYVNFVLEEVLKDEDGGEKKVVYSKEDEEKVKERLRGLGYL